MKPLIDSTKVQARMFKVFLGTIVGRHAQAFLDGSLTNHAPITPAQAAAAMSVIVQARAWAEAAPRGSDGKVRDALDGVGRNHTAIASDVLCLAWRLHASALHCAIAIDVLPDGTYAEPMPPGVPVAAPTKELPPAIAAKIKACLFGRLRFEDGEMVEVDDEGKAPWLALRPPPVPTPPGPMASP